VSEGVSEETRLLSFRLHGIHFWLLDLDRVATQDTYRCEFVNELVI
jgi:hypothetical protein